MDLNKSRVETYRRAGVALEGPNETNKVIRKEGTAFQGNSEGVARVEDSPKSTKPRRTTTPSHSQAK